MRMSKRLAFALGVTVAALAGVADRAMASGDSVPAACRDLAPAPGRVRQHLRCLGTIDVNPPQTLAIVIGGKDVPQYSLGPWGTDATVRWAQQELEDFGCQEIVWLNGPTGYYRAVGKRCDY